MGIVQRIQRHGLLVVLLSLTWLLLRSGSKPSRFNYPCQQAAKTNIVTVAGVYFAPILAAVELKDKRLNRRVVAVVIIILAVVASGYALLNKPQNNTQNQELPEGEPFPIRSNSTSAATKIFAVNNYTGTNGGLSDLLSLMGENGSPFYKSRGIDNGLFAADDVVIIKVNSQWDQRGGTNTDLLKELIGVLLAHPDGFSGEIVVADNGQAQYGSKGRGGSFTWDQSNAEDHTQSVQRVVEGFSGAHVSTYRWDDITTKRVEEYSAGDDEDGYIVEDAVDAETGALVSYPKFTTEYGTHISFKLGIWSQENRSYDSPRLKVINLPVLKTHGGYGVTGAVKSYMGVPSDKLTAALGRRTHSLIGEGAMGTLMAGTRFPTITILDCIWVNAKSLSGPATSYVAATRVNVVAASVDSVALDSWASKNILMKAATPGSDTSSMNPDSRASGSFGEWLRVSAEELAAAGLPSELDPTRISVYLKTVG